MSPTIALGGDVMLGRGVAGALAEQPPADVWSPELRDVFGEADIALVNLECCISEGGEPWDPERKSGGQALADTLAHLARAGIAVVGAGRNIGEARAGREAGRLILRLSDADGRLDSAGRPWRGGR